MSTTPTQLERAFLRALAAINPDARPGADGNWWSAYDLQHTVLFRDFAGKTTLQIAALGRSTVAKGLAVRNQVGGSTHRHGWAEYRITSYGRGMVADSCIGGGLRWPVPKTDGELPACPACHATYLDLGLTDWPTEPIPAHPLPGYAPPEQETVR